MMLAEFKEFKLKSLFHGNKQPKHWDDGNEKNPWQENWNNHVVHVRWGDSGLRTSFEFWGSTNDPEIDSEEDLLYAFQAFIDDVIAGEKDFEEFCGEFGFDTDSRRAERIWRMCRNSARKFRRITFGIVDPCDLYNELQEYLEGDHDADC